jgi:aminoglycoside phosphotransferase family enzyme/predicted kinase
MMAIPADASPQSPAFKPSELLTPSAFPHPVGRLEVRETNISWVILTGVYAYKIKKSLELGFIDTSTLAKRKSLCKKELRLNRRLAPDLYVDVVPITRDGVGLRVGGNGPIVEYAVRMRQFEASEELSMLLERGTVSTPEIADFAVSMAVFHTSAPHAPWRPDHLYTQQLHDAVLGNIAILLSHLDADTQPPELGALIDWTHDYLHYSLIRLRLREQSGFIRECHGDLHAGNVVRWRGRLTPFDCLEFNPKLRWIDVMNDVAFLVMDLVGHDRKDLAFSFLNTYLEHTGDYAGVRLLPFYSVYRALVRAMVDSIGAEQNLAHREEFRQRLRMRIKTAAAVVNTPRPTLFIMHGPAGSGKSYLSERLERKRLAGSHHAAGGLEQGIYTSNFSHRTYAHLLDCAESCLQGGVIVIVDAAFLTREDRRLFRQLSAKHIIISCQADRQVLAKRIEMRQQAHLDPSDADLAVLDRQLQIMQPLRPDEQLHSVVVDTSQAGAYETTLAAILDRLGRDSIENLASIKPHRSA